MKYKEVAKILRVTRTTISKYVSTGKIRADKSNGHILEYNDDDVYKMAGVTAPRKCVIYARVPSIKQEKALGEQIDALTNFAVSNGCIVDEVFADKGSGFTLNRQGFQKLISGILSHSIKAVYVMDKNVLSCGSFEAIQSFAALNSCSIIVASDASVISESATASLVDDILSFFRAYVKSFPAKPRHRLKNALAKFGESEDSEE